MLVRDGNGLAMVTSGRGEMLRLDLAMHCYAYVTGLFQVRGLRCVV